MEKLFRRAVHPGEVLRGELEELGLSQAAFARQIRRFAPRSGEVRARPAGVPAVGTGTGTLHGVSRSQVSTATP